MTRPITIMLAEGISAHVVIGNLTVAVTHTVDADGDHALQLGGVDCDLEGEGPGLYYPVPRAEAS